MKVFSEPKNCHIFHIQLCNFFEEEQKEQLITAWNQNYIPKLPRFISSVGS